MSLSKDSTFTPYYIQERPVNLRLQQWEDQIYEDYCIYLEQLDPDMSPMSPEAFEWARVREEKQAHAETLME